MKKFHNKIRQKFQSSKQTSTLLTNDNARTTLLVRIIRNISPESLETKNKIADGRNLTASQKCWAKITHITYSKLSHSFIGLSFNIIYAFTERNK